MPWLAQAEAGNVKLVRGPWCAAWLDEITAFPGGSHDDQVDSMSGAYAALVQSSSLTESELLEAVRAWR
jgi:predicted phage terminase large subunit-like protein